MCAISHLWPREFISQATFSPRLPDHYHHEIFFYISCIIQVCSMAVGERERGMVIVFCELVPVSWWINVESKKEEINYNLPWHFSIKTTMIAKRIILRWDVENVSSLSCSRLYNFINFRWSQNAICFNYKKRTEILTCDWKLIEGWSVVGLKSILNKYSNSSAPHPPLPWIQELRSLYSCVFDLLHGRNLSLYRIIAHN